MTIRSLKLADGLALPADEGVAFFLKQRSTAKGKKISLPELDGKVWKELPMVRP